MELFDEFCDNIDILKDKESLQKLTTLYETRIRVAHLASLFDEDLIEGVLEFGEFVEQLKRLQEEGEIIHAGCLEEVSNV